MEKQIVYVPVEIKSQADLPKEPNWYFAYNSSKGYEVIFYSNNLANKLDFIEYFDWYLQPVEMPTEEEMKKAAEEFEQESSCGFSAKGLISDEFYQGAKWFKDKLK